MCATAAEVEVYAASASACVLELPLCASYGSRQDATASDSKGRTLKSSDSKGRTVQSRQDATASDSKGLYLIREHIRDRTAYIPDRILHSALLYSRPPSIPCICPTEPTPHISLIYTGD